MLVDRPVAEVAAAGERYVSLVEPAEKCAEKIAGSAHSGSHIVRYLRIDYTAGVNADFVVVKACHLSAHRTEYLEAEGDIAYLRTILKHNGFIAEKSCRNDSDRRILGAAYRDFALQRLASAYNIFIQVIVTSLDFFTQSVKDPTAAARPEASGCIYYPRSRTIYDVKIRAKKMLIFIRENVFALNTSTILAHLKKKIKCIFCIFENGIIFYYLCNLDVIIQG